MLAKGKGGAEFGILLCVCFEYMNIWYVLAVGEGEVVERTFED